MIVNSEEGKNKFGEFWWALKSEWFKVEVLQDYTGIDNGNSLRAWLAGDRETAIALVVDENKEWAKMSSAKPNIRKVRFHIVENPYTPYLEWEIEACYKHSNIPKAKEDVYLIEKNEVFDLDLPDGDFSIFDSERVVKFIYDVAKGVSTAAEVYDHGDDIGRFLRVRDALLKFKDDAHRVKAPQFID